MLQQFRDFGFHSSKHKFLHMNLLRCMIYTFFASCTYMYIYIYTQALRIYIIYNIDILSFFILFLHHFHFFETPTFYLLAEPKLHEEIRFGGRLDDFGARPLCRGTSPDTPPFETGPGGRVASGDAATV